MRQHEEEWKDKCAAMGELRALLGAFDRVYAKISATEEPEKENSPEPRAVPPEIALFSPENVQQLTQPFRETLSDLRSAVVREACTTLSELARIVGPDRCKLLVRDVFPTLMSARGTSNKVCSACVDWTGVRFDCTNGTIHRLTPAQCTGVSRISSRRRRAATCSRRFSKRSVPASECY